MSIEEKNAAAAHSERGAQLGGRPPGPRGLPFLGNLLNRFALMEMILILATVAQRYRLQWHGARPVVPLPSITLRPKGGIRVQLAPRAR